MAEIAAPAADARVVEERTVREDPALRSGRRRCTSSSSSSACSGSCRRSASSSRRCSRPRTSRTKGWWQVFTHAEQADLPNYDALFHNERDHDALHDDGDRRGRRHACSPIIIGALAGYAFAWLEFPGRDWWFIVVIALLVVPLQMALIPMFRLYRHARDLRHGARSILFHTAFGLPFAIFLLRNFFIGIPKDILESARIDGASELRIFLRLILPLGLPAIASLAIFQFLWTWNDLIVALTFGRSTQPITVAIFSQLRQFGAEHRADRARVVHLARRSRWSCSSPSSATSCRGCWRAP